MIKTVNESIQSIQKSLNEILSSTENLSEEVIRWNPSEEEWSILQILSHLVEGVTYWLAKWSELWLNQVPVGEEDCRTRHG